MRGKALAALQAERWQEAAACYAQVLEEADSLWPHQAVEGLGDVATNYGAILRRVGQPKQAAKHYAAWVPRFQDHHALRLNGINCLIELEDWPTAAAWIDTGLNLAPMHQGLQQAKARLWMLQGQGPQARQLLEQLTQAFPQEPGIWLDLSLVCHRLSDLTAALEAARQATGLDPTHASAWGNQITLLKELGQLQEAEQLVRNLPTALRQQVEVKRPYADLLMAQQRMAEAEAELAELCQLQPMGAGHWVNRAACLRHLKHFLASAAVLKQGLRWQPKDPQLQESLAHCLIETGKPQQGLTLLRQAFAWDHTLSDDSHASLQFLGAGYQLIASEERAQLARAWEQHKLQQGVGPLWADRIREPLQGRRLRLGYFSADWCDHPVGRFLLPILQGHNHDRVEIWGLHCGPHHDHLTKQLRQCCDHWLDLRFGTDLDIARIMADQGLDAIVELGGFTGLSRIGALILRPAPVQVSYLGFPGPTYLQAIDAWIGDEALFAGLNDTDRIAHKLIHVGGGYMAYSEPDLPEIEEIHHTRFRFGCFNHSRKLSEEAVELFGRVLKASPDTELVLKSVSFVEAAEQQRVRQRFEAAGVEANRLKILNCAEGRQDHLRCYQDVDAALDPMPYGGATTSCEALAMGVPVVALAGPGMVGGLSSSLLTHSGHKQWIAQNEEHYIRIATNLAAAGPRKAHERHALRKAMLESPLGDGQRLASALEGHIERLVLERFTELR